MGKVSPLKVRENGQRYRDLGRKTDEGFYLALLDIYNKGLAEASRLEPKKCDWRIIKSATKRKQFDELQDDKRARLGRKR